MTEPVIDDVGRPEPPLAADEVRTLVGFLDYQRATFEWKAHGLDDDQLRQRLHPTAMTLGGLLKHLAFVEDHWFHHVVGRQPPPPPWDRDWTADPDWEFTSAAADTGAELRALWAERVRRSRALLGDRLAAGGDPLSATYPAWGGEAEVSLRWVLAHLIEEYARHNGHADLLREAIDGEVGE